MRASMAVAVGAIALVLFAAVTSLLASARGAAAASPEANNASQENMVAARRAFSIPFGIADTQELNADGDQVLATGHGICWEESQMFDLQVTIVQSTTQTFAQGHTADICTGDRQTWEAQAQVDDVPFEAGPARVCAQAVEWAKHGTADEHQWCKDVTLVQSEGENY